MSEEFHAIYDHGVLRLDQPLALPDQTRVAGFIDASIAPVASQTMSGQTMSSQTMSDEEFERQLDELAFDVAPLPPDFSRADIYADHD